jgi:hypothetical protein
MIRWFCAACLGLSAAIAAAATPPPPVRTAGRLGVTWGVLYGFPPAKSESFMPQARALGASFSRITLYWSQLEPKQGTRRWADLDAYLDQLQAPEEGMITLAAASPWATRSRAWVFPSSPATEPARYEAFVRAVIEHAKGRVRYFQAETEPNNGFFWAGSADDYAAEQRLFYTTVKAVDPKAMVVLAGSDGLFDPTGADPMPGQDADLAFLKREIAGAKGAFDLFDLHLYGDPYTIPARVEAVRQAMRAAGTERPIVANEYAGPTFFEFHANRRWFAALQGPGATPEAVRALRARAATLPPETRMFLQPDDAEMAARLFRLQSNDLVVRNMLALSSGVERTAIFDLWHDTSQPDAPNTVLYGALKLLDHDATGLNRELPLAAPFRRLALALAGTARVERIALAASPDVYAFRVERRGRPALLVAWRRPATPGAASAPLSVAIPWHGTIKGGMAIDGSAVAVTARRGMASLVVTEVPVLAE